MLSALGKSYADLQKSYKIVDRQRAEANEEVAPVKVLAASLRKEVKTLQEERLGLTNENERIAAKLANDSAELHDNSVRLASVNSELGAAQAALTQAQRAASLLLKVGEVTRTEPMTYSLGQEVVRRRVGPHLSVRQAHDALTMLKRDASAAARARGAGLFADTDSYAFVQYQHPSPDVIEDPPTIEEAIVRALMSSDRDGVLVARATGNAFRGEAVPLEIRGLLNPIVYHKGDVLGVLNVAKNSKTGDVIVQFNDFMSQRVHDRAIKDGMIPATGQEDSLVDIEPSKTFNLVEQLANAIRPQQLRIVARADTRAADALQLDFVIK